MSQVSKSQSTPDTGGGSLLRRVFGHSDSKSSLGPAILLSRPLGHSRLYPARLSHAHGPPFPSQSLRTRRGAENFSDVSSAATNPTLPKSPLPSTGTWVAPGPTDNPADPPRANPTIASTSASLGLEWSPSKFKLRVPSRSFKSFAPSLPARPIAPTRRRYRGRAPGKLARWFRKGNDHVLVTLHSVSPESLQAYTDRLTPLFAEGRRLPRNLAARRHGLIEMSMANPYSLPGFLLAIPMASA